MFHINDNGSKYITAIPSVFLAPELALEMLTDGNLKFDLSKLNQVFL